MGEKDAAASLVVPSFLALLANPNSLQAEFTHAFSTVFLFSCIVCFVKIKDKGDYSALTLYEHNNNFSYFFILFRIFFKVSEIQEIKSCLYCLISCLIGSF